VIASERAIPDAHLALRQERLAAEITDPRQAAILRSTSPLPENCGSSRRG
jgi:hypothetical protein